jgi:hypothetical protein
MNYKTEFPHYDDDLSLPKGWKDTSWHNDACPSFEKEVKGTIYRLWCDFKDPSLSEIGGLRFSVSRYLEKEDEYLHCGEFNTITEATTFVHF